MWDIVIFYRFSSLNNDCKAVQFQRFKEACYLNPNFHIFMSLRIMLLDSTYNFGGYTYLFRTISSLRFIKIQQLNVVYVGSWPHCPHFRCTLSIEYCSIKKVKGSRNIIQDFMWCTYDVQYLLFPCFGLIW